MTRSRYDPIVVGRVDPGRSDREHVGVLVAQIAKDRGEILVMVTPDGEVRIWLELTEREKNGLTKMLEPCIAGRFDESADGDSISEAIVSAYSELLYWRTRRFSPLTFLEKDLAELKRLHQRVVDRIEECA